MSIHAMSILEEHSAGAEHGHMNNFGYPKDGAFNTLLHEFHWVLVCFSPIQSG